MKNYSKKWWYSVVLAVMMVWFLLVLTSWVFWLILWESKDTKAMENYLKSYQASEWWIELALLKAKNSNYSIDEKISDNSSISKIYWNNNTFSKNKDVTLNYDLQTTSTWIIDKTLSWAEFDIIPLLNMKSPKFSITTWVDTNIVWNIVWNNSWISWTWAFDKNTTWNYKTIQDSGELYYTKKSVWDFLNTSSWNYLIIQNVSTSDIKYSFISTDLEKFTSSETKIISSWKIAWYKQNLRLTIDNWEYLNLLKYSIFDPN